MMIARRDSMNMIENRTILVVLFINLFVSSMTFGILLGIFF